MDSNSLSLPSISPAARTPRGGFAALELRPELLDTVRAAGYREATPIQREAIPHVLEGRDVLGCAQTGTGKTAAFALPILDELLGARRAGPRRIRALVLAPTRELAAQIADSFARYSPVDGVRCAVLFGGVSKTAQRSALRRGVDVLVATPGRLLDLLDENEVELAHVQTLVLDEADRMLDMGFIHDVRRIVSELPRQRQTLLFSATMPPEIRELAQRILRDPVQIAVDPVASTVEPIEQSVYLVESGGKLPLLLSLLRDPEIERALVFTRTKRGANRLTQKLCAARIEAAAIHGNKSQSARERALEQFKRGDTRVMVATDLASRGIDVKELSHVICFELPNEPEAYVHRVGRTGRAGASGTAIALCAPDELPLLAAIEKLTRRRLERRPLPEGLPARAAAAPRTSAASRSSAARPARRGTPRTQPAAPAQRRTRGSSRRSRGRRSRGRAAQA